MDKQQSAGQNEQFLRRYEYGDSYVIAADLGMSEENVDVDIVGETAIVVIDTDGQVRETEFELPGPNGAVEVNNGVLTVTIEK